MYVIYRRCDQCGMVYLRSDSFVINGQKLNIDENTQTFYNVQLKYIGEIYKLKIENLKTNSYHIDKVVRFNQIYNNIYIYI